MSLFSTIIVAACGLCLWLGLRNGIWLPGLAALATTLAAWSCSMFMGQGRKRTTSMPRLDRLGLDRSEGNKAPDKPEEEQDYALVPKE